MGNKIKKATRAGIIGAAMLALSACGTKVDSGNFAIVKGFNGTYKQEILEPGRSFRPFSDVIIIDGKNVAVTIQDIRPKDVDGILLEDLDINVTYNIAATKQAIKFAQDFSDIKPTEGSGIGASQHSYALGSSFVQKVAKSSIMKSIRKYSSTDLLDEPQKVKEGIIKNIQEDMDAEFGKGLFEITDVNFANVKVSSIVENRNQAVAAANADAEIAKARISTAETRKEASIIEMKKDQEAAQALGITVGEFLERTKTKAQIDALKNGNQVILQIGK